MNKYLINLPFFLSHIISFYCILCNYHYFYLLFFADGFDAFRSTYPEWCDSCTEVLVGPGSGLGSDQTNVAMPLMGLRSLRISAWRPGTRGRNGNGSGESSDSADERCDSSLGLEDDREFPVEILPHLFLGNAANSEDLESLSKHGIKVRYGLQ